MKRKIWCWVLVLSLLLCGCQTAAPPDVSPGPSARESAGEEIHSSPPAETPAETESGSGRFPPQPEVCGVEFTQTESFPMPFDGELYVNGYGQILLSANEALYDYDTMWLLLEENFPYLDRIEAEMGIDWRAVRDSYRTRLEQQAQAMEGYLLQGTFINIITQCLNKFHEVGHLYVIRPTKWHEWGDSWLALDDTLFQTLGNLMRNPRSEQFYQGWEKLVGGRASGLSANGNATGGETVPPGVTFGMAEDIPYVKISTFSGWTDGTYDALSQFLAGIEGSEHLIIDVQGNGGGDIKPWIDHIVAPLIQEPMINEMFFAAKAGSLNLALRPQLPDLFGGAYTDDSWREDFPYIQPEHVKGLDLLFKVTQRIPPSEAGFDFNGKIWVLIDNGCYSSTDQFAVFCKATGFATLVGTETGGNGIGMQPYIMALPYSGLVVYYEPYLSFNPDGSCNGIRGTQPDLVPGEGQSALDACLAAIHAEETNK